MSQIKFGCQFYTWQMCGQQYIGDLSHILKVVNIASFAGIEPETCMLGSYYDNPLLLQNTLSLHSLELGALAFACYWAGPGETEEERREADYVFNYLKFFPKTHLVLTQLPGKNRSDLRQRQSNLLTCVNAIAKRATDHGIICSFHPNSPPGSVFRSREDYRILLNGLNSHIIGFTPDTGHIAKGGIDIRDIFGTYRSMIKHIHFKDITASGKWTAMGAGTIDFPWIVAMLRDTGYAGWVMVEEESPKAKTDPDAATIKNGEYLRRVLLPIIQD